MTYEYLVLYFASGQLEDLLNERAADGWRLVSCQQPPTSQYYTCVFERVKPSKTEPVKAKEGRREPTAHKAA